MRNSILVLILAVVAGGAYFVGASGRDDGGVMSSLGVDKLLAPAEAEVEVAKVEDSAVVVPDVESVVEAEVLSPDVELVVEAEVPGSEDEEAVNGEDVPFSIGAYNASKAAKRWAVYLDDTLSALDFIDYDVVVFDSHKHPDLRPLDHQGKALLARMNFFFLDEHESFYTKKEKDAVLFEEERDGQAMRFVDIRNTEWLRIMIEKKIPHLTNMGFNGLLLEGVDDAVMLERKYPDKYFGMIEAVGRFIRTVKQHFPYLKIMLKDSMHVASIARNHVDMILFVQDGGEGLLAEGIQQERTYAWMDGVKKHVPDVGFYSLDFIDMKNMSKSDVKALYAKRRSKGLIPYVAQEELERHYVEPF